MVVLAEILQEENKSLVGLSRESCHIGVQSLSLVLAGWILSSICSQVTFLCFQMANKIFNSCAFVLQFILRGLTSCRSVNISFFHFVSHFNS